jgi:hypothetical protein
MNALRILGESFIQLFRQIWFLPQTIANAAKQKQQRAIVHELEVERLDRIRNPHKYRGK